MATLTKETNGGTKPLTEYYWEPLPAVTNMRRLMDSFFDSMMLPPNVFGNFEVQPKTNVYEKDGAYTIECAVPGYGKEDVTVEAKGSEVTITGKYEHEKSEDGKQYRRREMRQGSFSRTIDFPEDIDPEHVSAALENGVLTVTVHPVKPIAAKKIPVTTK